MRKFLDVLSGHGLGPVGRYVAPVLAVTLASLLRVLAPLDVVSFLLYLPLKFLVALVLGRGAGAVTVATSLLAAAWFFGQSDGAVPLGAGQVLDLVQYLVVSAAMVGV